MADELIPTVVTKREDTISRSVEATTPSNQPNVQVVAMPWWQIVLIRTARVYLQGLMGFLTVGATGLDAGIMPNDFLGMMLTAAKFAIAPAAFTLLQNAMELLMKLDVSRPTLRA